MQRTFSFRMDEQTYNRLETLSRDFQRTRGNLIRWLIYTTYIQQGHSIPDQGANPSSNKSDEIHSFSGKTKKEVRL
jgi:hypothetical protein